MTPGQITVHNAARLGAHGEPLAWVPAGAAAGAPAITVTPDGAPLRGIMRPPGEGLDPGDPHTPRPAVLVDPAHLPGVAAGDQITGRGETYRIVGPPTAERGLLRLPLRLLPPAAGAGPGGAP